MKIRNYREDYYKMKHKNITGKRLHKSETPIWHSVKEFINNLESGEEFRRKEILNYIYCVNMCSYETTVDWYRLLLTHVKILEHTGWGIYRKNRDVPKKLTTTQLRNYAYKNNWESWFTPLNMIDELKRKEE